MIVHIILNGSMSYSYKLCGYTFLTSFLPPLTQIVITGVGAVTPVGIGADEAYKNMCDGKSGIRKLPSWADEFPAQVRPLLYTHFCLCLFSKFLTPAFAPHS